MRSLILSILGCITLSTNAYAMFCPTNFVTINYGDTMEHVLELCGKPTELKHYQTNTNTAQQWTFYVKPRGYEQNGTVKMTVLLTNNQVANITIDDQNQGTTAACQSALTSANSAFIQSTCNIQSQVQSLSSTQICGFPIKIGDTGQVVQVACGKPALTQAVNQDTQQSSNVDLAELTYSGPPGVVLTFENNRLKDRRFI